MSSVLKVAAALVFVVLIDHPVEVFEVTVIEGARPRVYRQDPRPPKPPNVLAERVKTRPIDLAPRTFREALRRSKDRL